MELFLADVENQVTNMAGRAGARHAVQKVQEYADKISEAFRPYGPAVPEVEGVFMDAKEAQAVLHDASAGACRRSFPHIWHTCNRWCIGGHVKA